MKVLAVDDDEINLDVLTGYLTKPLTLDRLREALGRWLSAPSKEPIAGDSVKERDGAIDLGVVRNLFGDNQAMVDRVLDRFRIAGAGLVGEIRAAGGDAVNVAAVLAEWRRVEETPGAQTVQSSESAAHHEE